MHLFVTSHLQLASRCRQTLLLVVLLCGLAQAAWAVDFQRCRSCHAVKMEQAENRLLQHQPFLQKQCAACHATVAAETDPATGIATPTVKVRKEAEKVTWLAEAARADVAHSFLLPAEQLGNRLAVDLRGELHSFPRRMIALPRLQTLAEVEKNPDNTEISGIKVLEVKRRVFLSVLIGWQTSQLTHGQVRYGMGELEQSSDRSQRFGRSHEVRLYNLQPDQQYRFQIVATDLFGRSVTSEILEFLTSKTVDRKTAAPASGSEIDLQSRFQRLGSNFLVQLQTDRPVAAFVGTVGEPGSQSVAEPSATAGAEVHAELSSGIELGIVSCLNCHPEQAQTSHPVNVLPESGMIIPPDYPTLPDGRITCASCHQTHSSNNRYLAMRRGKRELCVGCHKDML
jgi:predicted CXXCH cytochrome family protein